LLELEMRTVPVTITVTNLNDSGAGSLRAAIITANSDRNASDIVVDGSLFGGTITLTSNLPSIVKTIDIEGPGHVDNSLVISGNGSIQPFNVGTSGTLTLAHLTLTNARSGEGGAVLVDGTLQMDDVAISNCGASGLVGFHAGGAIAVDSGGSASLAHCVLSNNFATSGGGAVFDDGSFDISESRLEGNFVGATGVGGAISVAGPKFSMSRCLVSGNQATDGGGISFVAATSFIPSIQDSTIADNRATGNGGGIDVAPPSNGAINVFITRATFANNQAGSGGSGGGGIFMTGSSTVIELYDSSVARNSSTSTNAVSAGGVTRAGGILFATNSIISDNTSAPGAAGDDIAANGIHSGSNNFVGPGARLGSLRNNGGFAPTMMPLPGSPAIDAAGSNAYNSVDERRFPGVVDGNGDGVAVTDIGACEYNPGVEQPIAVGTDAGVPAEVRVYDYSGALRLDFFPYGNFAGGVRVATGDINGDGILDVVTAAGGGGGPHVRVFNGLDGSPLASFFAYDVTFTGGVYVATADVNNDGKDDIITGAGLGGGPHVKVFSGADVSVVLQSFMAYSLDFTGGVRVAAGDKFDDDFNGDQHADIVTSPGPGGGPHVQIFSGADPSVVLKSFFAYDASFTGGVFVAVGNVDNDGLPEVITSPGAGMAPMVRVFHVVNGPFALMDEFSAYATNFTGGVTVAAIDRNGDFRVEIITGAGPGGGPHVRSFSPRLQNFSYGGATPTESFFAFDPTVLSGVFVG
jgi:hypothetical protein